MSEPEPAVTGQPTTEVAPVNVMTAPPTEPAPPIAKEVAPKYAGKSLEEFAREAEEKDRVISELNENQARLQHDVRYTQSLMEQFARERGKAPEEVPKEIEFTDDEFLTSPGKVFTRAIKEIQTLNKQEREQERIRNIVNETKTAFEQGKEAAFKANPSLFKGIEAPLSNDLAGTVQNLFRSGQPVDSSYLKDPKQWESMAVAYRMSKGESLQSILSKYYSKDTTPMTPAHQETPTAGAVPKAEMTLSPEQEELISKGNITREQFMEAWKKERSITEGRNR